MLTFRSFQRKVDSYGANLQRWPCEVREEARALLKTSPEARALFDEARILDESITAASAHEGVTLFRSAEMAAALTRLRLGMETRIAASTSRTSHPLASPLTWVARHMQLAFPDLNVTRMSAAGGGAIAAGLLVGCLYGSAPAPEAALVALLQPAPIHILAD